MYTTDPTEEEKRAAAAAATELGTEFYPRGLPGGDKWRIDHNDVASSRTMLRNIRTGEYVLVPTRRVSNSVLYDTDISEMQAMDGSQANYFMDASKTKERYSPGKRGTVMQESLKARRENQLDSIQKVQVLDGSNTNVRDVYRSEKDFETQSPVQVKRKGGLLYN